MSDIQNHDPVAAAKALAPQISAARGDIQSQCQLPDSLAEAMAQAGLLQLYVPAAIGGPETVPITAFDIFFSLIATFFLERTNEPTWSCTFFSNFVKFAR